MPDEAREGFMFFRSYYEGAKELDDEQRLAFYDALIEYALNDTEPTISGVPKSCFAFVKPVLDRSKARAEAGRKGGKSKREANSKQNGSNSKQPGSKPEAIKDKGRDKGLGKDKQEDEEDNPPYPPSGDDVGQPPESPGVDPDFSEEEPPRPRRRKPSTLSKTQEARFNRFWAIYPRKVSIGDAEKAWAKIISIHVPLAGHDRAPRHTYLFLTKNPQRYCDLASAGKLPTEPNFWYGTTITGPDMPFFFWDKANTFVSVEPLLEPFDTEATGGENPFLNCALVMAGFVIAFIVAAVLTVLFWNPDEKKKA